MKKNLQRFLVASATMMTCLGANAIDKVVKTVQFTGEITTVEGLQENKFVLQNEEGNILHTHQAGQNYWDCYVTPITDVLNVADAGVKYTIESLADVENGFILPVFKADGSAYTYWAGEGYVNAQPSGSTIFALAGKDGQHGQDGKNLAVWNVSYTEGSGFAFKNVGRDIYLGFEGNAARPSTDVKYWKAFTDYSTGWDAAKVNSAAEEVLAALKTSETKEAVNTAKESGDLDAIAAAVNNAIDVINECDGINGSYAIVTDEAVKALIDAVLAKYNAGEFANASELRAAYANAIKSQNVAGANMTLAIINPSFETGTLEGWTSNNCGALANNMNFGENIAGQKFVERWTAAPGTLSDGTLLQTLEGMPNGTYKLTANMQNLEQKNNPATNGTGFFLVLNDALTDCAAPGKVEVESVVTDGILTIGVKLEGCTGNWMCVDNFELTLVEPEAKPEPKQLTAGDYFIINAESGKFLNGNNAWGTKASVTETAQLMTLAVLEDGTYTIDSHISNGGDKHFINAGENLFVDGAASAQTIAEISNGIFSIKDVNGKFLAADAEGIVNFNAEDATSAAAQWKIVTKDELLATFDNATAENPVDANFLISDANFGRNNTYNSAWQGDKPAFGGVNYKDGQFTPAGQIAEVWGGNVKKATDYYQEIEVPNGIYTLSVQGFYRYNNTDENTNDVAQAAHADGTEVIYSKLYANSDTVSLKSLFDDEVVAAAASDETVKIPFSLTEAGNAFAKGFYVNTVKVAVKTGVLKFGVTKTEHIGTDWTVWDNFRLTYNGKLDEPVPAIDEAIAKLDLAIKAADEKLASYAAGDALFQYSESELAPLANAIAAANAAKAAEDATEESINAAKTALNEAVEAFAPKANAPKEGQAYILTLTTAENNQLSVSADGIKIEAEGTPVYFVAQENGYAISNGTEYVNYEGSNNWTMTASAEAYGWTIALVEGGYSITGKNGLLGTNANEKAAGSPCYGDKKTSNGNYIWAITEYVAPEPVNTHENDLRLPLTGGSGEGTELAIEVLESNEDGQPLSAKYTITNGTWGNNASHLSIFKYNLTPDMIKGYKSVIVEFAEALPVSEGNPEYNFIPCGFVCPEGWVDLDGKDVFELEFTDKQKTEGIADFSIFFNANGDVKNATFTIKGLWLVKDATEQPDAIDTVEASENATSVKKMMVDGKIVIVKGGKTYNVAGSLIK